MAEDAKGTLAHCLHSDPTLESRQTANVPHVNQAASAFSTQQPRPQSKKPVEACAAQDGHGQQQTSSSRLASEGGLRAVVVAGSDKCMLNAHQS